METDSFYFNREFNAFAKEIAGVVHIWSDELDGWVDPGEARKGGSDKKVVKDEEFSRWYNKIKNIRTMEEKTARHHSDWADGLTSPKSD